MAPRIDRSDQQMKSGAMGPVQSNMLRAQRQGYMSDATGLVDPANDLVWAQSANASQNPAGYFDYFFTGQDIKIYMDGVDEQWEHYTALPVMQMGFSIQQQKQPVYGFWSYTYDAVMRGTRMVNGMFRIATTTTDYMTNMVAKAAESRANKHYSYVIRGLDRDEKNIEKYWTRNMNSDIAYSYGRHLFNSHPPFNLIVLYGLQSTSITNNLTGRADEVYNKYKNDTPLYADVNERLVSTGTSGGAMRYVIENIEITGLQVEYGPDGEVCSEVYNFFARDLLMPREETNRSRTAAPSQSGGGSW